MTHDDAASIESLPGPTPRLDEPELGITTLRVAGDDPAFERLLRYLKESRAFDFTGYKRASLMRRVRHQMSRVSVADFDDYQDYLEVHPDEFAALFDTILINVTDFFRDREAWDELSAVILPELLERSAGKPLRLWSAGCSAGQEPYSLAIALTVLMGLQEFRTRVKIYATDVDEDALAIARQASYTEAEVRGLPQDYLTEYFEPVGPRWVFRKDLRRSVIFGRNDLVQDAPISRIDLLACRNTLMYFNAEAQTNIVSRLGFALKPDGVLFLGKAEMLLNHATVFAPLDPKRRFFRRSAAPVVDDMASATTRRVRPILSTSALGSMRGEAFLNAPVAQVVIDADGGLALVNHRAAAVLGLGERDLGRPFHDLDISYRPAELRSHLTAVQHSRTPTWIRDVEWPRSPRELVVLDIQFVPMGDAAGQPLGVSIMFHDVSRYRALRDELESMNRQLEMAYEELQSTNEELETTNEELQSTVEELETTNEELQSTNEELETMNEELHSMNDELQITNSELHERGTEVTALNRFMESILGSLRAAVVVLDPDLIVQVWSRHAEDLWGLREAEAIGAHFLNLDSGLPAEHLRPVIRDVLQTNTNGEITVSAIDRRGRTVQLSVIVTPLDGDEAPAGALLLMEPVGVVRDR